MSVGAGVGRGVTAGVWAGVSVGVADGTTFGVGGAEARGVTVEDGLAVGAGEADELMGFAEGVAAGVAVTRGGDGLEVAGREGVALVSRGDADGVGDADGPAARIAGAGRAAAKPASARASDHRSAVLPRSSSVPFRVLLRPTACSSC